MALGLNRLHNKCVPKSIPSHIVWSRRNARTEVSVSLGGHFFYSTENGLEQAWVLAVGFRDPNGMVNEAAIRFIMERDGGKPQFLRMNIVRNWHLVLKLKLVRICPHKTENTSK